MSRPNSSTGPPPVPWYSHPRFPLLKRHFGVTPPPVGQSPPLSLERESPRQRELRMFVNAVYYPNWSIYKQQPPSSLKLNQISHVYYSFAWLRPDGSVYLSDEFADTQIEVDGVKGCLAAFWKLKQQHTHLKVILSVGGGGKGSDNFKDVAADMNKREMFAYTARELCIQHGLDGIDIDWEHPTATCGQNYLALLDTVRRYLPKPFLVTTALPCGEWALHPLPLAACMNYLDFLNLMAYDFSGPWSPLSGHHAQLYTPRTPCSDAAAASADAGICYVRSQGVPAHKIILGIPAYGRSFLGAEEAGEIYEGCGGDEGTIEYKDLPERGATEHVDLALGAAYCKGGRGGWVSYDNVQTVKMKAAYVKEQGLGGVFYWTGTGDKSGDEGGSLIEASFAGLHS
ncbi:glycoside hydrolase superfamily [Pyronema omphalodes]|nr:glycoside hydrolase superfamily [Pyronema omphalodes]